MRPRNRIAVFVKFVKELERKHAIRIRSFGHAGDGNLHIYVCKDDLSEAAWREKLDRVMRELYDKAIELDGKVSGEHGIGHAKVPFLRQSEGETYFNLIQAVKQAFDPQGILNPGKVCGR